MRLLRRERRAPSSGGARASASARARKTSLATLLPRLRLPDAGPVDPRRCSDALLDGRSVILEIGFGGGEHLAAEARAAAARRPHRLRALRQRHGEAPRRRSSARASTNIRLWDGDATALLPRLARGSLDRRLPALPRSLAEAAAAQAPLPLRRHARGASPASCRPGGELRFATDIDDYAGWALARVLRSPRLSPGRPSGPTTGASPGPAGPARATRRRPRPRGGSRAT